MAVLMTAAGLSGYAMAQSADDFQANVKVDVIATDSPKIAISRNTLQVSLQSSLADQQKLASSAVKEPTTDPVLLTKTSLNEMPAGVCLVVESFLKDFCAQYPADYSCQ